MKKDLPVIWIAFTQECSWIWQPILIKKFFQISFGRISFEEKLL